MPLTVTHIGGPTALISYAGQTFLSDPTFDAPGDIPTSGNRTLQKITAPAISAADLPQIDVVLLSHDQHADNLDQTGRELLGEAGKVFSTPAAATRISSVVGLAPWESAESGPVTITAVPALHGPEAAGKEAVESLLGEVSGFVLSAENEPSVYVSGDNASSALISEIADRFPDIGLAILFAGAARTPYFDGAPLTLTSAQLVGAVALLPHAVVVPVHTEGWAHFSESPADVQSAFDNAGLADRVNLLDPGSPTQF